MSRPDRRGGGGGAGGGGEGGGERGAAIVDFVLVALLVTTLFLAVVQLAVIVHVRNTLIDCAADGARFGALAGNGPDQAMARTRSLVAADLSAGYAQDVSAEYQSVAGLRTLAVRVRAPLPLLALLGAGHSLEVTGHALVEGP